MLIRNIMKILAFFILLISTSSFAGEYETNFNIEKFKFAQKNGKIVIIHSWNKSCSTCAKQKPILEKAKKEFQNENLIIKVKDYYFSNVIARSSKTMVECNNSKLNLKSTGTEG